MARLSEKYSVRDRPKEMKALKAKLKALKKRDEVSAWINKDGVLKGATRMKDGSFKAKPGYFLPQKMKNRGK